MRILLFGINYSPELTGIGKYTGEMGTWLAKKGHDVSAITALPYYPEWQIHQEYRGKTWMKENISGVTVYRCPLYVPRTVTSIKRIIHEFSFLLSTIPIWLRLLLGRKFDVVVCISPPFHLGFISLLYCRIKKAKLVNHIQDLQIDAAKELGMIRNERFLKLMFDAESYILHKSAVVSTISPGMRNKIVLKGISEFKMWTFPNWVDTNFIRPLSKSESLRNELGIKATDTVILYSGNLGEKQGLEIIIEAAQHFSQDFTLQFVISGSGGGKLKLQKLVDNARLSNIHFIPLQPFEKLPLLLAIADLHLVVQKKSASDLVMPSKLTGILSAGGCPLVSAVPGTSLYKVVSEHQLGFLMEPESGSALISAISQAMSQPLEEYRKRARNYAVSELSQDAILQQFTQKLSTL